MTRRELQALLESLDMHPSRKLGQNFLVDANQIAAILATAGCTTGERVLEIGPGAGAMTLPLLAAGVDLTAVEYDLRLAENLRATLTDHPNFRLVQADAARVDYDELMGALPFRVVANLPYAASTPILAALISAHNRPIDMSLMLQKEMADRLAASPGTKTYGSMSVRIQILYQVSLARRVPRTVFYPVPDVDSAVLRLEPRADTPGVDEIAHIGHCVKAGFGQRRKQLASLLTSVAPAATIQAAFAALEIAPTARAEELCPDTWLALSRKLADND